METCSQFHHLLFLTAHLTVLLSMLREIASLQTLTRQQLLPRFRHLWSAVLTTHDVPFVAEGREQDFDYSLTGFSPTGKGRSQEIYFYTNHAVEDSYYKTLSWKAAGFEKLTNSS